MQTRSAACRPTQPPRRAVTTTSASPAHQALLRCWGLWFEEYEASARQKRVLAAAGARLLRPKLVACFSLWSLSWMETQLSSDQIQQRRALELQAAEAKVTRLTNEVMRLRGMSVNCTDETVSARPFC